MNMKTIGIAVIVVALVAAFTGIASAEPAGGSEYTQSFGTPVTNASEGASNAARGGNITQATFTGVASQTGKWQGYYGNLTGSITLGSSGGTMKSWSWSNESNIGYVLATTNTSIPPWQSLVPATGGDINTAWQFTAADRDSATNTFNDDTGSAMIIAGKNQAATADTQANTYNANASADKWYTVALDEGTGPVASTIDPFVFVGINNASAYASAYNDVLCDYQMIVPVYHYGGALTDDYYFYVELR